MISRVTSYHLQLVVSPCSSMKAAKTGEDTKSSQSPSKDDLVLEESFLWQGQPGQLAFILQ